MMDSVEMTACIKTFSSYVLLLGNHDVPKGKVYQKLHALWIGNVYVNILVPLIVRVLGT